MSKTWAEPVRRRRPSAPTATTRTVARRLRVGAVGDPEEREAEVQANRVVDELRRAPAPFGDDLAATRVTPMSGVAVDRITGRVDHADSSRIRRSVTAPIGRDGGDVDEQVQARLDATRGRGSELGPGLRRSMEHAFGNADFRDVRVHAGAGSADLNARLGARAFTVGQDIYLGHTAPPLSSAGGRHLLAHELTHTLQQGSGARRDVLRRLLWNAPLRNLTSIQVLGQGASGVVAKVADNGMPVFVKADQEMAPEMLIASNAVREGKFKSGNYSVIAPRTRLATVEDMDELKQKSGRRDVVQGDPRDFVTRLNGKHPTVIAEAVDASTLKSAVDDAVGKKKFDRGKPGAQGNIWVTYAIDRDMVAELKPLLTKAAPIKALAKATAVDLLMGMGDRTLNLFNAENFTFDPRAKQFGFIDNIKDGMQANTTEKATLPRPRDTKENFDAHPAGIQRTLLANLANWMKAPYVAELLAGKVDDLAQRVTTNYTGWDGADTWNSGLYGLFLEMALTKGGKKDMDQLRAEMKALVESEHKPLVAAAKVGLKSGVANVLSMLAKPGPLTQGLPEGMKRDVKIALLAKRHLIKGAGNPDVAVVMANRDLAKLEKRSKR